MPPIPVKPVKERRPVTEVERNAILECSERLGEEVRDYIILLLDFGLRPSEAGRALERHFDLDNPVDISDKQLANNPDSDSKKIIPVLNIIGSKSDNATRKVPVPANKLEWAKEKASKPDKYII